jgi:hypothetical protein
VLRFDTRIVAQDYVNVFELFDVARAAARVEHWVTPRGSTAASGRCTPIPGYTPRRSFSVTTPAAVPIRSATAISQTAGPRSRSPADDLDAAGRWHDRFRDELGHWLATQHVNWRWRHGDDLWVVGNSAPRR